MGYNVYFHVCIYPLASYCKLEVGCVVYPLFFFFLTLYLSMMNFLVCYLKISKNTPCDSQHSQLKQMQFAQRCLKEKQSLNGMC